MHCAVPLRTNLQRLWAARRAEGWGYPRPIRDDEIRGAVWLLRHEPPAVLWFTRAPPEAPPNTWTVHGCASPEARRAGRQLTAEVVRIARGVGHQVGAWRVYSALPLGVPALRRGRPFPVRAMRRYLLSQGFDGEDAVGAYIEIGGRHGV